MVCGLQKSSNCTKLKKLSAQDVAILEGMALYDPRNISDLAITLRIPRPSLRYRIKKLHSNFSLGIFGNIYHTFIGLRKSVVLVDAKPGYEDMLYESMKTNDYWLYLSQCIGSHKIVAIYGIPLEKEKAFERYIGKLGGSNFVRNTSFLWTTCIQVINTTGDWFNKSSCKWSFPWQSWKKEILGNKGDLPYTLKEPDAYLQKADWLDIMILKELEKDSTIRMAQIAKKFNTSLERVMYHYKNHVIGKGMFEGYQVIAEHYKGLFADSYFFQFYFTNRENLTKLANSFMYKPFVRYMGKEYEKNRLFAQIYLPREQLTNFIAILSELVRTGFLETYDYAIQDLARTQRQTISYEFFKNNAWQYDENKYTKKLDSMLK